MPAAIDIQGLNFRYPGASSATLDIESWALAEAEQAFVSGPSGSGKTTLLSLISGMLKASEGRVAVLGEDLSTLSAAKRDRFRATNIGVIFQDLNLIPWLTVEQNLLLAPYFAGGKFERNEEYRNELLERMRLDQSLLSKNAAQLSRGQQQRVAIIRALINKPQIIIADEPCSALDYDARDRFMSLLMESLESTQASLLFVSHDLSLKQYFSSQYDLMELNRSAARSEAC
jgi:putative ABC transport system ATP-binding protein